MAETSGRLLLLLSLLQSRRDWPGPALAERLGVSARTMRRDIDRLRELGYPVSVRKGPGGAYRLDAGARLPPLLFDDDQAVAIALALQTAPTAVAGTGEAASRALATIRQVMPPRLRRRVESMEVTSIWNAWGLAGPEVDSDVIRAVADAVRDHLILRLDYASEEGPRAHRVEPHNLVEWGGRWFLVAWDLDGGLWRTFRVDRIAPRSPAGPGFVPRAVPGGDVGEFVTGQLDRGDPPDHWPCRGEVLLDAPAALIARWAPGGAVIEELGPGRCRLKLGAWSWVGLAALIGTFDCDIEVAGPPELSAACRELGRRFAAAGAA
ncbi:WYL domain-containing protein [Phytomonospora sp. NPDC050363]|uniref:helix-turn-helix transcriptional regulator n=1 Tax=Phytomonospora sp. NPDC050363 TaxID=3155642 RepID=UPI0033CEFDFF